MRGTFNCVISAGKRSTRVGGIIIEGHGTSLLGHVTAVKLGILKVGLNIATVSSEMSWQDKYPQVFDGVGKLKNRQVRLHIDESVSPVAQPLRRIPYQLRSKVEAEIQQLLQTGIIEPVNGPTPWINPVVAPKKQE